MIFGIVAVLLCVLLIAVWDEAQVFVEPGLYGLRVRSLYVGVKDTRRHMLLFSQRNGYWPCSIRIGHWWAWAKRQERVRYG